MLRRLRCQNTADEDGRCDTVSSMFRTVYGHLLSRISLFSFAKYLELLIYSPSMCTMTPTLCEHTTPGPSAWSALPLVAIQYRVAFFRVFDRYFPCALTY